MSRNAIDPRSMRTIVRDLTEIGASLLIEAEGNGGWLGLGFAGPGRVGQDREWTMDDLIRQEMFEAVLRDFRDVIYQLTDDGVEIAAELKRSGR